MKVIRKHPDRMPEVIDIPNDADTICAEVDGPLKAFKIARDLAIIFDADGQRKDKEPNVTFSGLGVACAGTVLVVGIDGKEFCDVPTLDKVLFYLFDIVRYGRADRAHNVWKCRRCGHLQQFEADGPYENGWNVCPSCGGIILRPASNGKA